MAAYENYWSRFREPSYAEKVARRAAQAEPARCPAITKKGNPCQSFATSDGLCSGHSQAREAGKEIVLA